MVLTVDFKVLEVVIVDVNDVQSLVKLRTNPKHNKTVQ